MPDPTRSARAPRSNKPTTPEEFPTNSPLPSGDYSYTVEVVMKMQHALGALTEAVAGLKDDSKAQRHELAMLSKDVHSAKVVVGVVGSLIVLGLGFIGWAITTYLNYHKP